MKYLVTGTAGFIGYHVAKKLLERGEEVIGLDVINDYYDINLKYSRLASMGIAKDEIETNHLVQSTAIQNYRFIKLDLAEKEPLMDLFAKEKFDVVINLAAQAGVRYSLTHPEVYIQSNIISFLNILEA